MNPSPYPPPKGGGWRTETERPAPTPLSLPLERGGGAQRRRGSTRQLPPSVEEVPPNSVPSQFQQPKGGGRLVSPHAALSPELGSSLKARSGRKSGTTAPGVQGAGRGPRRPPPYPPPEGEAGRGRCPRKKGTPCRGGTRQPLRRDAGKFQGGGTPPPGGANPPECRKIPKEETFQLPAHRRPPGNTKLGPPLAPAGPPPHRGGPHRLAGRKKEGPWGPFSCKGPQTPKYA